MVLFHFLSSNSYSCSGLIVLSSFFKYLEEFMVFPTSSITYSCLPLSYCNHYRLLSNLGSETFDITFVFGGGSNFL